MSQNVRRVFLRGSLIAYLNEVVRDKIWLLLLVVLSLVELVVLPPVEFVVLSTVELVVLALVELVTFELVVFDELLEESELLVLLPEIVLLTPALLFVEFVLFAADELVLLVLLTAVTLTGRVMFVALPS